MGAVRDMSLHCRHMCKLLGSHSIVIEVLNLLSCGTLSQQWK